MPTDHANTGRVDSKKENVLLIRDKLDVVAKL